MANFDKDRKLCIIFQPCLFFFVFVLFKLYIEETTVILKIYNIHNFMISENLLLYFIENTYFVLVFLNRTNGFEFPNRSCCHKIFYNAQLMVIELVLRCKTMTLLRFSNRRFIRSLQMGHNINGEFVPTVKKGSRDGNKIRPYFFSFHVLLL